MSAPRCNSNNCGEDTNMKDDGVGCLCNVANTIPGSPHETQSLQPPGTTGRPRRVAPRSSRPTRSGGASSRRSSSRSPAARAPSGRSAARCSTTSGTASTPASAAGCRCSRRAASSTPAPAGPASSSPWPTRTSPRTRPQPRHGPHRDPLRPLRRPPRPRLRGRPAAHRPAHCVNSESLVFTDEGRTGHARRPRWRLGAVARRRARGNVRVTTAAGQEEE